VVLTLNHSFLAKFPLPYFSYERPMWLNHSIRASGACAGSK
jgi:hypothetical protein